MTWPFTESSTSRSTAPIKTILVPDTTALTIEPVSGSEFMAEAISSNPSPLSAVKATSASAAISGEDVVI